MSGVTTLCEIERVLKDAIDATSGENTLLHGTFVLRAFVLNAANIRVFAFDIFPYDQKVDVTGFASC